MSKRFMLILLVLAVGLVGVFWFTRDKAKAPSAATTSNHVQGAGNKGVTLVEYGDFQCPACGGYYPIVEEVRKKYGEDITFQFRNYPLVQLHPNAMAGHRAAEAADKQGKFWEMYHLLYEQQQQWSGVSNAVTFMEGYAQQLGLDPAKFKQDFSSEAVNDTINADIKAGQGYQISGTPTFILNGKKLEENPRADVDSFSKVIDQAIADKSKQQ